MGLGAQIGGKDLVRGTATLLNVGALVACVYAGCDDGHSLVRIDMDDGAYLRGEQISKLEISDGVQVIRSELFLNGLRVASDDFAPFELAWDTRNFVNGGHTLAARIYLGDGSYSDSSTSIRIDNMPPSLGELRTEGIKGQPFDIPARDNLGIASVEISDGRPDSVPMFLAPPYRFTWPWDCGHMVLHIRVVDRAGGETVVDHPVASVNLPSDHDCDGHLSFGAGGDDCNDADATIYLGAFEYPDGVDRDCNGFAGSPPRVDADGDGVASFASGGDDCNDGDPTIHGAFLVLDHRQISIDGQPLQWNPGEAAVSLGGLLSLNRNGVVQRVELGLNGSLGLVTIASDANPGSISVPTSNLSNYVAYGRGNEVVIAEEGFNGWTTHAVINANGRVGRIAFVPPDRGVEYAVFQAGTEVWFASSSGGAAWTMQLLVDAGAPLEETPLLTAAPFGADVAFRTAGTAWKSSRSGVTSPLTTNKTGPAGLAPSAIAQYAGAVFVAVDDGTGSLLQESRPAAKPVRFPRKITRMFAEGSYLYVQLDGLGLQVLSLYNDMRRVQSFPEVGAFDTAHQGVFAGNGYVHTTASSSVRRPADISGDGIDRNCDGADY